MPGSCAGIPEIVIPFAKAKMLLASISLGATLASSYPLDRVTVNGACPTPTGERLAGDRKIIPLILPPESRALSVPAAYRCVADSSAPVSLLLSRFVINAGFPVVAAAALSFVDMEILFSPDPATRLVRGISLLEA
jgi:hypothetical protein